jgi:RNA polymerase sigma-70 factor, ECF subfamily
MDEIAASDVSTRFPPSRPLHEPRAGDEADRAAVERVGDGEAQAVAELYDRHSRPALALARQILGTEAAAEDVVQEAFVSVWRHASRYDPARGSVRSWLLGIVRYRALDALRRDASAQRIMDRELSERLIAAEPADVLLQHRARALEVREAVAALPEPQAQVIALAFYGGLTQAEIADELSVPLGTIKSRVRLALRKLAAGMAPQRAA